MILQRTFTVVLAFFSTALAAQNMDTTRAQPRDTVKAFVSFIIELNGKVSDVQLESVECKDCSERYKEKIGKEAVRIVKKMPGYKAIKQRTKFTLPIKFIETGEDDIKDSVQ